MNFSSPVNEYCLQLDLVLFLKAILDKVFYIQDFAQQVHQESLSIVGHPRYALASMKVIYYIALITGKSTNFHILYIAYMILFVIFL